MNSRRPCSIAILALLLAGPLGGAAEGDPRAAFIAAEFATPPNPATLDISGPLAITVSGLLGHPYRKPCVPYWTRDGKTVWVLEDWGKSCLITAGFVIQDGAITRAEVLAYKERRGREIQSRRFLRQFEGVRLRENQELNRSIDAMTGATISSTTMVKLARLALHLETRRAPLHDGPYDIQSKLVRVDLPHPSQR
jgi:hypothetical protein